MIEDRTDPAWGAMGRLHIHARTPHVGEAGPPSTIKQLLIELAGEEDDSGLLRIGAHLARSLDAGIIVWLASASDPAVSALREATGAGVEVEIRSGEPGRASLARSARSADLNLSKRDDQLAKRAASMFGSPWLFVPHEARVNALGERVAICWDGSLQALMALRSALPLMRDARSIVIFETSGAEPSFMPQAADVYGMLARHGFETFVNTCTSLDAFDEIAAYEPDLLVAGTAWARRRLVGPSTSLGRASILLHA